MKRFYVSAIAYFENGQPVFDTLSDLDGMIVAWQEDIFHSLLAVGQTGYPVFVADEPSDLPRIARQVVEIGPRLCLLEKDFFCSHFQSNVKLVGEEENVPHA